MLKPRGEANEQKHLALTQEGRILLPVEWAALGHDFNLP